MRFKRQSYNKWFYISRSIVKKFIDVSRLDEDHAMRFSGLYTPKASYAEWLKNHDRGNEE